jgi:hypothetical protein
MILDAPMSFIKFAMSIQEMQPFDEHLEDTLQIAAAFGFPGDLVPRKDNNALGTVNKDGAEKSLYTNTIIPEAESLVGSINNFLEIEKDGMYISVSFDHVAVLQPDKKAEAESQKIISETCEKNFMAGIITLNDWIAKTGGERRSENLYNKYILDMSDEELRRLSMILNFGKNGNNSQERVRVSQ